tara:strand:- start:19147 stop:20139 length:993 start_codon:yes stop_codon:yes gene_type:complete
MNIINDSDLTFVIQGAVSDTQSLTRCIQSIKKYFFDSKIILSTWKGSDCSKYDIDNLVLSDDTNLVEFFYKNQNTLNNINRQIISTRNGLKKSNTKYSVKIRTDIVFKSNKLLKILGGLNTNTCKRFDLKSQIITPIDLCLNPEKSKLLYHFNDWIVGGLTEDILKIFDIPLMTKKDLIYYKDKNFNIKKIYTLINWYEDNIQYNVLKKYLLARFTPEQYIYKFIVLKKFKNNYADAFFVDNEHLNIHKLFFDNCISKNTISDIDVMNCKHIYNFFTDRTIFYTKSQIENKYFDFKFYAFKFIGFIKLLLNNVLFGYYPIIRNFYYKIIK